MSLLVLSLLAQSAEPLLSRPDAHPREIVRFLEQRAECEHWAGEEPYDKARRREINRALRDLGCLNLRAKEQRLRKRYQGDPGVIALLDQAPF